MFETIMHVSKLFIALPLQVSSIHSFSSVGTRQGSEHHRSNHLGIRIRIRSSAWWFRLHCRCVCPSPLPHFITNLVHQHISHPLPPVGSAALLWDSVVQVLEDLASLVGFPSLPLSCSKLTIERQQLALRSCPHQEWVECHLQE